MRVTGRIHSLEIPFEIPVAPGKKIDRAVFVFLVLGEKITLIDTGVSGSESRIFDYIRKIGRDPKEISTLILSHSHPDHIGAARSIHEATGCKILAHKGEKEWIENTSQQFRKILIRNRSYTYRNFVSKNILHSPCDLTSNSRVQDVGPRTRFCSW